MRRLAMVLTAISICALAPAASAAVRPLKPAVTALTVSPVTLPASGGAVRISVRAVRARTCTLTVGAVARTYRCASGILVTSTTVNKNAGTTTERVPVSVFASGLGGRSGVRRRVLTVATDVGPLGATLDVHGEVGAGELAVTLTSIIDPATPSDEFDVPSPGTRFVAIQETLQNIGQSTVSDDTYSDVSVIGSDGQGYSFSGATVNECSSPGTFTLTPGESESTCEVYEIPNGVNVATVHFTLSGGYVDTATWNV
jgi:hypothetical protein